MKGTIPLSICKGQEKERTSAEETPEKDTATSEAETADFGSSSHGSLSEQETKEANSHPLRTFWKGWGEWGLEADNLLGNTPYFQKVKDEWLKLEGSPDH